MQQIHQELREIFRARVHESFARARTCLAHARVARRNGLRGEFTKWMWCVRVLRVAAADWRQRAQRYIPLLVCLLWCLNGCAKAPPRELSADFNVQPSKDGTGVLWSLRFNHKAFQTMLDSTPDRLDGAGLNASVHEEVRHLIAIGLESHHLNGCSPSGWTIARTEDGAIAFLGWCTVNGAQNLGLSSSGT